MTTEAPAKKQRAFATDVTVSFLGMTLIVDAVPVRTPAGRAGFHNLCPECDEPTRMQQMLGCEHGHGPFTRDQLEQAGNRKGRTLEDETLVEVSAEEYEEATGVDLPIGVLNLEIYRASDVETLTRPDDTQYRLREAKKGTVAMIYGLLRDLLREPGMAEFALVGEINLKGSQKPVRLVVWQDQLVLQSLVRPSDLAAGDLGLELPDLKAEVGAALKAVASHVKPFVPDEFRNLKRERLAALDEAKALDPTATVAKVAPTPKPELDLMALLTASIEAAEEKRAPAAKKPRAKKAVA